MHRELDNFDPVETYGIVESNRKMHHILYENLLVDNSQYLMYEMALANACEHDLIRGIQYALVVNDVLDHGADYKKAGLDLNIPALRKQYCETIDS